MEGARERAEEAGRSMTALFIRRPVLAFVLNALIVIAGLAGLMGVEIRELPEVDRPVVSISTNFDGASPETVDREITERIESAAARVSGVAAISSMSRFGESRVTVEFGDDADLNIAATDVGDAVARIRGQLPDDVDEPRVVKSDANADPILRLALTSATRSPQELTQLSEDLVEERLLGVAGVADIQVSGGRTPVFRVETDMLALASRGLTVATVREALENVAFDSPAGSLSSNASSLSVRTTATVQTPEQFERIVIAPGVELGDVASVSLGPDKGESVLRSNGQTGVGLGIIRQAQSNTLDISRDVKRVVAELKPLLPRDVSLFVTNDSALFIEGAIHEVELTLTLAAIIVIAVIWLFLRDWRATLIPAVALPVSLIGTVAAVYLAGFSINILTLLALLLATGLVVDDAIVVLENIVRRRAQGMGMRAAAVLGTQQVFFAVVATTLTLIAVFVPLSFLPGQTGGLFREFGFTMAIAVALSGVVALTLCPVLCARLLTRHEEPDGLLARIGGRLGRLYASTLRVALDAPWVVVLATVLISGMAWLLAGNIRQEVTPPEDRANIALSITAPQGVSLDYTSAKMAQIEAVVEPLRRSGEVRSVFSVAGSGGRDNRGYIGLSLAPWGERDRSQQEILADLRPALEGIVGIDISVMQPNSLGIRGAGRGLSFAITGSNYDTIADNAARIMARMEAEPEFGRVELGYEQTQAQLFIAVDRRRASDLGVSIEGLGDALQAVLDGRAVGEVFVDDKSYDIKMFPAGEPVDDPGDLERIFARTTDGLMVPISAFVTLEERAVAPQLGREDQMRAVEISADLTPELGLGAALSRVQQIAAEELPEGSALIPLGEAATLGETASGLTITFGFAMLVVFLVLAAQFESFIAAVIVMATVPFGLACAIYAMLLTGTSMNTYSQIGLVLLVGIMAKNGILIVEFANQLRDEGASVRDAVWRASTIRLRPVMMTMAAAIVGGIPLIFSHGAGAEARVALGWIIVGGLGLATVATLYLTPVAYLLLAGFSKPKAEEEARLQSELRGASQSPAE